MNFYPISLLVSLSLSLASCDDCPRGLLKRFKQRFTFKRCNDGCVILGSRLRAHGKTWTGFCSQNSYVLFSDWECREPGSEIKDIGSFARVTENSCQMKDGEKSGRFDENCLKIYNYEECKTSLGFFVESGKESLTKSSKFRMFRGKRSAGKSLSTENRSATSTTFPISLMTPLSRNFSPDFEFSFVRRHTNSRTSTSSTMTTCATDASVSLTITTSKLLSKVPSPTSSSVTSVTSSSSINTTVTTTSTTNASRSTSTSTLPPTGTQKTCEENEKYFDDHCYFFNTYNHEVDNGLIVEKEGNQRMSPSSEFFFNTRSCKLRHPKAVGLAVETTQENNFVLSLIKKLAIFNNVVLLTSGVRQKGLPGKWRDWDTIIDENIINCKSRNDNLEISYYFISPRNSFDDVYWYQSDHNLFRGTELWVFCERVYNPKNVRVQLHEQCLNLYRKSKCHRLSKHSNYCCAKDDNEELWFGCPLERNRKVYKNGVQCVWHCGVDGLYIQEHPNCVGNFSCMAMYNNISYVAAPKTFAIEACPNPLFGYSKWYCNENGVFEGSPDYSLCCKNSKLCRDTDSFLKVWVACPSTTAKKKALCPPGSLLREAVVKWHCREDGTFNGSLPDYSNCNKTGFKCSGRDKYGRLWVGFPGETAEKDCPPSFNGTCFWKCNHLGKFECPQPDCSQCRADWMNEVADEIKKGAHHEVVMEVMTNYTKVKDLTVGFCHVLKLTSACVDLFRKQNCGSNNKTQVFNKFLSSYSNILKNVAGNPGIWSTFLPTNRRTYAHEILETTQNASFAKLGSKTCDFVTYNATFSHLKTDGFDFFVSYNPSIRGTKFPFRNFSDSSWWLEVKELDEDSSNFAAMGLVMNFSLSSLVYPLGNETIDMEMNAPAIAFSVATYKNGETVLVPDVVVSLSFRHVNKTRFPKSQVVKRRLHSGEQPSGVIGSTRCYHYSGSEWNAEGCSVTFSSAEQTNCVCRHLSTIGLLMTIHKYEPNSVLELISLITSGITIVSLILTLIVFYAFNTVKNDRVLIGKNLCFCLLIGHIMLITVMDRRFFHITDSPCTVYAILLHYVFMAAFAWMFVEGCHLYRMLVLVFDSDIEYRFIYILIGYGVPLVVVGTTQLIGFAFKEQPYGQDELCWLKSPNYVWAFIGPAVFSTSINFLILITAMKLAISSKMRTEKSNFSNFMIWIKGWISLSTLLGITWLFGLAYIQYDEKFMYSFVVLNGLQGFFIFIFRCICNEQYRTPILQKFKSCFSSSKEMSHYKKFESNKSNTKLFNLTQSGSKSEEMDISGFDHHSRSSNRHKLSTSEQNVSGTSNDNPAAVQKSKFCLERESSITADNEFLRSRFTTRKPSRKSGGEEAEEKNESSGFEFQDDFAELSYHTNHLRH